MAFDDLAAQRMETACVLQAEVKENRTMIKDFLENIFGEDKAAASDFMRMDKEDFFSVHADIDEQKYEEAREAFKIGVRTIAESCAAGYFNGDGEVPPALVNFLPLIDGPSKESVDLAEKFYKAYSELQRKIEPGRNDWKKDEALLKELKEADDGKRPSSSIWGRPDHCKKLAPGVYTVDTPSHGGIMVSASVASKVLSPETLAHCSGLLENGYYQFEEDCDAAIPLVEMYRKGISEGYSWNEGRQAKFYELAQEEVLKWNAPLFESWIVSREKKGLSADEPVAQKNESYSCFYNRFENEYIAVRKTNGDWEYARLDDRFNVIYHDAGFSSKEEKKLEDAVKSVIELYYRPDDPIYVDYDTTPADYAALGERAKRLNIENWTRAGSDVEKAVNKSLGVNDFLREGGNVYEPKPVALEDIVGQMDFRLEVTASGKLKLWDLQRNEYLDNERLDGSPFGSEPEEYVSSSWEFSSAEEIFDRLDSFIRDYFYDDMASELERAGVSTKNASTLDDLCELWKEELNKGSKELSKGELNMALGIVNPDTVVMPKGFARSGKEASADEVEKVTCENFQRKLAERAERDSIKTAQALLSEMDEAERKKFNKIVRSQGLKKPEDVDAFFAALAKGTAAFEPKERKRTPPEPNLGM